jgi:hypothetical protein
MGEEINVRFKYEAEIVDFVKKNVPAGARSYVDTDRSWRVRL